MITFLRDKPALILNNKGKRFLVVADLHIGITTELRSNNIFLPSQSESFAKKLNAIKKETKANNLIILGDLKHSIPRLERGEILDIAKFVSLLDFEKIILIKGNHDGNIENILKKFKRVKVKKRFLKMDQILLTHGHIKIHNIKRKTIIMAHVHPYIKIVDRLNTKYFEQVWLSYKDDSKKIIIMPNFNELCGATIVNEQELIGPIARKIPKKDFDIYLLDGTYLGKIKDFEKNEDYGF